MNSKCCTNDVRWLMMEELKSMLCMKMESLHMGEDVFVMEVFYFPDS